MNDLIQSPRSHSGQSREIVPFAAAMSSATADDRLDIGWLLAALKRRRNLIGVIFAVVLLAVALYTFTAARLYTTNSQVVLNTSKYQFAPSAGEQASSSSLPAQDIADTEVQVLSSKELAATVGDALNLYTDPGYDPALSHHVGLAARLKSALGLAPANKFEQPSMEMMREATIGRLLSSLTITRVGLSYAFDIQITDINPVFVKRIADEYANQYTQLYVVQERGANKQAASFLSGRLEQLQGQAQADTAQVQEYRNAHNLLDTTGASIAEQEISTYNEQVATARAEAAEDQARLATARSQLSSGSQGDDVGEALNSPVVGALRGQQAAVSSRLASLKAHYGPLYPDVTKAQGELDDINVRIGAEIKRIISNLEAKAHVSAQRLASLEGSLGSAEGGLASNNKAMVDLDGLQRRAEASQQLYDSYLTRYKQTRAQEGTEQAEARVTSYADLPTEPTSPKVALNLVLAAIIGAGLGVGAAIGIEMTFAGLTTSRDVESRLGLASLGSVPLAKSVLPKGVNPVDAVVDYPQSSFAEGIRNIRVSIRHAVNTPSQVVLITSSLPREGKTTTSACLGRYSAMAGEKVIILDLDVRQRGITRYLSAKRDAGIVKLLRGEATLEEVIVIDPKSGVAVIPVEATTADLGDLLHGSRMVELLAVLRRSYGLILLDSAPLLAIADTRSIATLADAVVMTARWRKTPLHAIQTALRLLPLGQCNVAGMVLTYVDMRKQSSYGYGDSYYYFKDNKHYYADA